METPPFQLICYRFDLQAVDRLSLPAYYGSTFRGGFGHALKKMVCRQQDWQTCTPCQQGNTCPYGYLFETTAPADNPLFQTIHEVPVPFVIETLYDKQRVYAPGELLSFDLILFGQAMNYLAYFLVAFEELGRMGVGKPRGRYVVQRIVARHPWNKTTEVLYDGVDIRDRASLLAVTDVDVVARAASLSPDRVTLRFVTPTRIKYQGSYIVQPAFHVLVRSLFRRISALCWFHGGHLWKADFQALITNANEVEIESYHVAWQEWNRFSGRQLQRVPLGGFMGTVTYRGKLGALLPLLMIGELVHVGKATVFGHGKYVIDA